MTIKSRYQLLLVAGIIAFAGLTGCSDNWILPVAEFDNIKSGFITPADTNKVWCYWYWLNDDISMEGVTKDLEAMKEAGIGGAFIGNINPDEVNGRVPLFSDQWWEIMTHAFTEAKRLGIDLGSFNCPGWSQSGGPWVKPEMAMRYLVHSEIKVNGGTRVTVDLPKPAKLFQDVYVLAIPDEESKYKNISYKEEMLFETNTQQSFSVDLDSQVPIKANTILLYPAKSRLKADCEIFAFKDGQYKSIKTFLFDRSSNSPSVGPDIYGPLAISIPGVESGKFRLTCKNLESNLPKDGFAQIRITEEVLLEKYVEKQLGKMHPNPFPAWGTYLWELQSNSNLTGTGIREKDVVDLSNLMDKSGKLDWIAPEGKWTLLRFGMTPTGTENSPAAPQGKGYEIDKANSDLIRYHFNSYIGELLRRIPAGSRSAFKWVIADSYEQGSENWTDGYAEKFIKRYGYDPKKYFPVLSGRIVGSIEESERFLWDLRRAISDDIAYEYVGGLRKISNENNLKIWLENYGHWGFPSEFLMYGGQSNLVGGEFWNEGELGNIECKAASSSAHIYGKPKTSAESFTAAGLSYLRYPALLKRRGDWSFTEGINQVVVHVYIHQPDDIRIPGMNAWFSTEFNRHNTWFKQGKIWFDYERRCQHLLQQGKYAADVCYFIGEDAPKMTGARNPELPPGYSCDYINGEVIMDRLSVKNGRFVLPDGMSYRLMVLPPQNTIRPELLEKISSLVKEGGVILGPKPLKSPSLKDYPACDNKVKLLADELWGTGDSSSITRQVGNGFVLCNIDVKQAFDIIKVQEDFNPEGDYSVLWTHRTQPGMDIYFITNQGDKLISFNPSFRITGKKPQLWDAVTGKIRMLNEFTSESGRTVVPITMEPGQSWFIVFCNQDGGISDEGFKANFPGKKILSDLKGPWKVDFENKQIGPGTPVILNSLIDLSKSDIDQIKYYSGTITYTTELNLDQVPDVKRVYLDLGDVRVIAHVRINGSDAGGVWMYPWIVEIKGFLRPGKNSVEIEVANLWRNRLIFDSRLPVKDRYTWTIVSESKPDEAPPSSGLIGPVTLKTDSLK
jgi:hypothetical protein